MRIAQERVHLLTTAGYVRSRVGACSEALYLNKPLVRHGLLALSSTVAALISFKLFRKKKKHESPKLSPEVGAGRYFITKLASAVLIPWLRSAVLNDAAILDRKKNK